MTSENGGLVKGAFLLSKDELRGVREDISSYGSDLLLLLVDGGEQEKASESPSDGANVERVDTYRWTEEKLRSVVSALFWGDIERVIAAGIMNRSKVNGYYYLNLEYPFFKYLLASETHEAANNIYNNYINNIYIYNNNKEGGVETQDEPQDESQEEVHEEDYEEAHEEDHEEDCQEDDEEDPEQKEAEEDLVRDQAIKIISRINDLRKQIFNLNPQVINDVAIDLVSEKIETYGFDNVVLVTESFFDWEGLDKPWANYRSTLTNFEKKLYMAKIRYGDKSPTLPAEPYRIPVKEEENPLPFRELYDMVIKNWELIQEKKIRICLKGQKAIVRIGSLGYRVFLRNLKGRPPHQWGDPAEIWRNSIRESTMKGGLNTNAEDDLDINGKFFNIQKLEIDLG